MIKTIHYDCGCVLSFREGKRTKKAYYDISYPPELCNKHNLNVGYDKK